jgi:Lrp/AsnC family transcriptional regulator for asnA, asnC and gidA
MAWAVLDKPEDLPDFVINQLPCIEAITRVETSINLQILKLSYSFLSVQNHAFRRQPPQKALDTLDLKLIRELRNDALQTHAKLGSKLGTSPATIRRKLQRLLEEKLVRIVAIADPVALGYNTQAVIGINVKPGSADAAARELASIRSILHVIINTGNFDLMVWVVLRGTEDLSKFVREELGRIQGIVNYETMVCLKMVKESFNWP